MIIMWETILFQHPASLARKEFDDARHAFERTAVEKALSVLWKF
jgi:hypothetical protein